MKNLSSDYFERLDRIDDKSEKILELLQIFLQIKQKEVES